MKKDDYQKNWRQKKQKKGAKLISVWLDSEEIRQIEDMKAFYDIENTSVFLKKMILSQHEIYLSEKDSAVSPTDTIIEMLERLSNLEKIVLKQAIPDENINYNPEEIKNVIIEMFSKGHKGVEIAKTLTDKGFKTKTGKTIDRNFVDKKIQDLKLRGIIS